MLLTKNYMYFISEITFCMMSHIKVSRKIPVINFEYLTMANNSKGFVLHIKDEDDVFLSTEEEKCSKKKKPGSGERVLKRILKEINNAYTNQSSKTLQVYRVVKKIKFDFFRKKMHRKISRVTQ